MAFFSLFFRLSTTLPLITLPRLFLLASLLALPSSTLAAQTTTWDFRGGQVPGKWIVNGWGEEPQKTAEGLRIMAKENGKMAREALVPHHVDSIRLTFATSVPSQALLVWNYAGIPRESLVELPFTIPGQEQPDIIELNMTAYSQWDGRPVYLGIGLPAGTESVLESIELIGYSPLEKFSEAVQSFWTFDEFRSYTINFLWGPLLSFSPQGRRVLFVGTPPPYWSANRIFYVILLCTVAGIGIHRFLRGRSRKHLLIILGSFASLWLLFDARMGMEILSYAKTDYDTYVSQPPGKRELRNFENFHDVVEAASPLLQEEQHYVLLTAERTPFPGMLAYLAYPATPLRANDIIPPRTRWLIFWRPEITLNDSNQLVSGSAVLSPPGRIVERYDDHSFLFIND